MLFSPDFLWTAPEILSVDSSDRRGNAKGDVYSLGIVIQETVAREGPFYTGELSYSAEGRLTMTMLLLMIIIDKFDALVFYLQCDTLCFIYIGAEYVALHHFMCTSNKTYNW